MDDVEVKDEKGFLLINISGDIENEDFVSIGKMLDDSLLEGQKYFAFQLVGATFLDSAALTMFVQKVQEIKKSKGAIAFINLSPECQEILEITKLAPYFRFFETEQDAKDAFSEGE